MGSAAKCLAVLKFLLAVDLGLKTGLALYGEDGKLRWYRSKNFGTTARLKRAVYGILKEIPGLAMLVIEGGGGIAEIWEHEAQKRGIAVRRITAEDWRKTILFSREQRTGAMAKERAARLADAVIAWSGLTATHGPAARCRRGDPDRPLGRARSRMARRAAAGFPAVAFPASAQKAAAKSGRIKSF